MDIKQLSVPVRLDYYLHCAETWTAILTALNIQSMHTIYDLCSGWSVKVELALLKTNFNGTVYCVDESSKALSVHKRYMHLFKPSYKIHYDIFDILSDNTKRISVSHPDLIIGNHIIDDLLLYNYCMGHNTDQFSVFSKPDSLQTIWKEILEDSHNVNRTIERLVRFLVAHCDEDTMLALTHYTGYQDRLWKYPSNNLLYQSLLHILQKQLLSEGKCTDLHQIIDSALLPVVNPYFKSDEVILLKTR
jgi:hypothetical protein